MLIKLAPVTEPPDPPPIIVFAVITLAVILFALIKLAPVIVPPNPLPEIIVLAITLPALMLPVYVVRYAPTLALPKLLVTGFAAK